MPHLLRGDLLPRDLSSLDVPRLFDAAISTQEIATAVGLSQRRVQQIVAEGGLRPAAKPVPSRRELHRILKLEVARHGGNYGWGMLRGALAAHHPGYSFPRRRVLVALRKLFPVDAAKRDEWTAQRLERGKYHAPHVHYSWHLDYACKMQDYGVYVGALLCLTLARHLCLTRRHLDARPNPYPGAIVDGCSRLCVSLKVCGPTPS